ncbi:MAG: flagellar export chaperone FliS [Phycisphaerales bacterium]|nr:flagellar export chaperone FliS [Phycisphaerales bacterium]
MPATPPNAYLRTKVMTASPAELRLLLIDGAIRFAEQARTGLVEQDHEKMFNGATRCQDIVMELLTTLRPDQAPELCERLSALYTYLYKRMVEGATTRDIKAVDEVLELLRYERETWVMLMDKLASDAGAAAAAPGAMSVQG